MPENDYDDELEQLTEQIQVGDAQEGAQALRKVIEKARGDGGSVRRELAKMAVEKEEQDALKNLAKEYPDFVKDKDMANIGMSAVGRQIERDLQGLGIDEERIALLRGKPEHLIAAHRNLRVAGHNVRPLGQVAGAAIAELRQNPNIKIRRVPRSPDVAIEEMRRKRGFADDEPIAERSTSSSRPLADAVRRVDRTAESDADRERRRAERIQQMRRSRGFLETSMD